MEYIRYAAVFLVIAKFFQVFIMKQENQKYIRGFAGILTLSIMLTPLGKMDFNKILEEMDDSVTRMQNDNLTMAKNWAEQYMTEETYSEEIVKKLTNSGGKINLSIPSVKTGIKRIVIPDIKINVRTSDTK